MFLCRGLVGSGRSEGKNERLEVCEGNVTRTFGDCVRDLAGDIPVEIAKVDVAI